jgi:hypothetical protein
MLAAAGLIAGLTLGSIAISNATVGTAWAARVASKRGAGVARSAQGSIPVFEAPAEPDLAVRRLPDLVAALTGMHVRDVEWQLHSGLSLAEVARDKGVTSDEVVAVALREFSAVLDGDVGSGRIGVDQKYRIAAQAHARFEARMSAVDSTSSLG